MNRTETLQYIVKLKGFESYLELGCKNNETFDVIDCPRKVGVDMLRGGTHRMTTDEFFSQNREKFDLIFIDAFHHHDQVMTDFRNSRACLNEGGLIVMHDCNPATEEFESQKLCGTAWRTMVRLRTYFDLDAIVGDFDHGVGIVRLVSNTDKISVSKSMDELTYSDLEANRRDWLRLRPWEDVVMWFERENDVSI